ncbi:MAG TPA: DHHA1 domain-containing protein [Methanocorpusculum sp.]|nr:DHHA1 domain-containing protein [Methanocorpusculum sp.]
MSLESAAKTLAKHIASQEYIEIYSHYDADGIAAAAIISLAISRAEIAFRLRILPEISKIYVENPEISLLCDFGASCTDLAESTMIIDHHVPYNHSPYHVNPHLFSEDGDNELSGAGCAYLVANALGDNRNLAGLVMLGILGDNQTLSGRNQKIIGDAVANNLINPSRGILLAGRTTTEQIANSLHPYLPNLSGDDDRAAAIESACQSKVSNDAYTTCVLSQIVLNSNASYSALMRLYGDSWSLEREVIPHAHTFTAVVDACGKSGNPGIAYALCCGDASYLEEAWEIAASYRNRVITAVKTAKKIREKPAIWIVNDYTTTSDAAGVFVESTNSPVFVLGRKATSLQVSGRAPRNSSINLENIIRTIALSCDGSGGGHQHRAGAEVPIEHEEEFLANLEAKVCM